MKAMKLAGIIAVMVLTMVSCGPVEATNAEDETVYVEPNIYTQLEAKEFELRNNPSSVHTSVGVGSIKFNLSSVSTYASLNKENAENNQSEEQTDLENDTDGEVDGVTDVTNSTDEVDGDEYE